MKLGSKQEITVYAALIKDSPKLMSKNNPKRHLLYQFQKKKEDINIGMADFNERYP